MLPVEFEPTVSAGERPQTYALDCAATGTGSTLNYSLKIITHNYCTVQWYMIRVYDSKIT
jgi:hypothetical protein